MFFLVDKIKLSTFELLNREKKEKITLLKPKS